MLLAGPAARFLAWAVDTVAVGLVVSLLVSVVSLLGLISGGLAAAAFILVQFVVSIGYFIALEYLWRGQTLGKRLLGLRVVDESGLRLRPSQVIIRNLVRVVDRLPLYYLLGGVVMLASSKAQRLGDLAAGTIVIRQPRAETPDLTQIMAGKYNSFRAYPHLEARLRQKTGPGEAAAALEALLRRDELDPAARVQLFSDLAEHFRAKAVFPADAVDGLSDEQYVRNVVEALYRAFSRREVNNGNESGRQE